MATVEECRAALDALGAELEAVDPETRARHIPRRTVACRLTDLDVTFIGTLDEDGLHDLVEDVSGDGASDVQVALSGDQLVALAKGEDDFVHAWLRGRVQISAGVRDLLRLRSLLGL